MNSLRKENLVAVLLGCVVAVLSFGILCLILFTVRDEKTIRLQEMQAIEKGKYFRTNSNPPLVGGRSGDWTVVAVYPTAAGLHRVIVANGEARIQALNGEPITLGTKVNVRSLSYNYTAGLEIWNVYIAEPVPSDISRLQESKK